MNNMIDAEGYIVPDPRSLKERQIANNEYKRLNRRMTEAQQRQKQLLKKGKCANCEMLLSSKFHDPIFCGLSTKTSTKS